MPQLRKKKTKLYFNASLMLDIKTQEIVTFHFI